MRQLLLALVLATLAGPAPAAEITVATGEPKAVPAITMLAADGSQAGLEAFRGQVVVLNLWATWCAPCREEMPSLDRLQASFAGEPVSVVALAVDRAGPERVQAFLDEIGVKDLKVYRDPKAAATRTLAAPGLPTTLLIDREGREVGRVLGLAAWDGEAAVAVVRRLLDEPAG